MSANKTLLKRIFPDLADSALDNLIAAASQKTYPPHSILCYENHYENTFYVIEAGEVVFSKKMGNEDYPLRRAGAGEYFGEMSLLDETIGRSATVTTAEETTVLELERSAFGDLLKVSPEVVISMAKIIIQRMRENDRQALAEFAAQKATIEKAYQDLKRMEDQRTQFLDTLAHELRTPLTAVTGYMQLVRGGHVTGDTLKLTLEKMGLGFDRLVSLINDLLFLQEKDTVQPHFRMVNMRQIFEEVIHTEQEFASRQKVNLKLSLPEVMPEITAEADGLIRAFRHLVNNAIKFSPDGGDVVVSAVEEGDRLRVVVRDKGVGIDAGFMPLLFKQFERDEKFGKHLFDGAGLGLSIVKRIIDIHAGQVEVDSTRGSGTTFTIFLPLDARRATMEINIEDAWVDVPD